MKQTDAHLRLMAGVLRKEHLSPAGSSKYVNQTSKCLISQVNTQNLFVRLGQPISWELVISLKDNIAIIEFFLISGGE